MHLVHVNCASVAARRVSGSPPDTESVHVEIHDRRGVQGEHLAHDQSSDDGNAQWPAQFGSGARTKCQRQRAEQRGHGGHENRPETQHAGLKDRIFGFHTPAPLRLQREVDHHDGVLLHQTDQQHHADDGNDIQVLPEQDQCQHRPDAGRRQTGNDGQGMHQAFVKHAQHDEYGQQCGEHQDRLGTQGLLIGLQGAGEEATDGVRGTHLRLHPPDRSRSPGSRTPSEPG